MRARTIAIACIVFVIACALCSILAFAQPGGPDSISRGPSERMPSQSGIDVQAQAGNVTSLSIIATQVTKRWQGFYGNVSGNLSLSDSQGSAMYHWTMAAAQGEIYAVNSSVAPIWTQVRCFNFSADTNQNITLAELEGSLGIGQNDVDRVNETFNLSFTNTFQVGSLTINAASGCKSVSLHVNDAYSGVHYNETILHDNTSSESVIYATILENDQQSFKGSETADFQLIVGENGDTVAPTSYYFYVELS